MFGNRKRKPNEEDDSLVPHGLIWYATEPPEKESRPKTPAEVTEITSVRLDQAPNFEASPAKTRSAEPPSSSPSETTPQIQEKVRTFGPPRVGQKHAVGPDIAPPTLQRPMKQIRVAEVIEIALASPEERPVIVRGMVWLRTSTIAGWNWTFLRCQSVGRNLGNFSTSFDFERRIHRGKEFTGNLLRSGIGLSRRCSQTAERTVLTAARSGLKQQRRVIDRVGPALATAKQQASTYAKSREFESRRVKIVLTGLALRTRILLARKMSEWRVIGTQSDADARLRSSMILAAISAIIALIIVSVVPHYAAKSLPSRIFSTSSTVSASTAAPAVSSEPVLTPAVAHAPAVTVSTVESGNPVRKKKSAVASTTTQASRRRIYRTAEDDYIAPDTYVYYGDKRAATH